MSQHLWSDVLSADTSFQRSLAQNMASKGYLVLKADKSVAKVMEKLRKQSTKFFTKSTLGTRLQHAHWRIQ
jgi:isopenicillin N synthase-like dioxygenase